MHSNKIPTLSDRLNHPIKTHVEAVEQLKKFKMIKDVKVDQKEVEKFFKSLDK
jgi:hypothetical protein